MSSFVRTIERKTCSRALTSFQSQASSCPLTRPQKQTFWPQRTLSGLWQLKNCNGTLHQQRWQCAKIINIWVKGLAPSTLTLPSLVKDPLKLIRPELHLCWPLRCPLVRLVCLLCAQPHKNLYSKPMAVIHTNSSWLLRKFPCDTNFWVRLARSSRIRRATAL